ncbi:hypothetical protein BAUCODRAFT_33018 [Baudoinia panamericana UAMH 10762]|uniref:F-box domain-containing protein n=1 Tax=Baudoinia panamericana (strain UAMH 10762) TaxID=717646 RepID=M2N040_BAUPA|nr:uncharacterized protein BAUCODRAFT_33018 [Baudoinia panamericana UAMH 10762]EMC97288.1 hypothetical protein BAUCODRAFT_33018 [Baudoinia panamericana UAMH 10762]
MDRPSHRALCIIELLEHIFSFLPARQLLEMLAVCRTFAATIVASQRLRDMISREVTAYELQARTPSFPPSIQGMHFRTIQTKGVTGLLAVINLQCFDRRQWNSLRHARPFHRCYLATPPPVSATVQVDCYCPTIRQQKLFQRRGLEFGLIFAAIDALTSRKLSCSACSARFYVRINAGFAVSKQSVERRLRCLESSSTATATGRQDTY